MFNLRVDLPSHSQSAVLREGLCIPEVPHQCSPVLKEGGLGLIILIQLDSPD